MTEQLILLITLDVALGFLKRCIAEQFKNVGASEAHDLLKQVYCWLPTSEIASHIGKTAANQLIFDKLLHSILVEARP